MWTGHLLASHVLFPTSPSAAFRLAVAGVVVGPLGWTAALAINDVHDLPADRWNPRKAETPLVRQVLSSRDARLAAYVSATAALGSALVLGLAFMALTAAFLVLAWSYSVPPLRLKNRPGGDVAVNAVGIGVLPLLAGWTVVQPLGDFSWWFLPLGIAVAIALYVPTTLVDLDADRAAGERTLATCLGRRAAYRVGQGAWLIGAAGTITLAATDVVIPRSLVGLFGLFVPALVVEYHLLIGRAATSASMVRGIVLLSLTFLVPSSAFALVYSGVWSP